MLPRYAESSLTFEAASGFTSVVSASCLPFLPLAFLDFRPDGSASLSTGTCSFYLSAWASGLSPALFTKWSSASYFRLCCTGLTSPSSIFFWKSFGATKQFSTWHTVSAIISAEGHSLRYLFIKCFIVLITTSLSSKNFMWVRFLSLISSAIRPKYLIFRPFWWKVSRKL